MQKEKYVEISLSEKKIIAEIVRKSQYAMWGHAYIRKF